jgi:hypothetical protein
MPIKPKLHYYYPIDWPQVSRWVRFVRAKGCCEHESPVAGSGESAAPTAHGLPLNATPKPAPIFAHRWIDVMDNQEGYCRPRRL